MYLEITANNIPVPAKTGICLALPNTRGFGGKKANHMKNIVFRSAEQQYHLVTIFTEQHGSYHPSEGMLLDFIETYGLNQHRQYAFTYSDNPADEVEEFVTIDPKQYLDKNFESVCKSYLKQF